MTHWTPWLCSPNPGAATPLHCIVISESVVAFKTVQNQIKVKFFSIKQLSFQLFKFPRFPRVRKGLKLKKSKKSRFPRVIKGMKLKKSKKSRFPRVGKRWKLKKFFLKCEILEFASVKISQIGLANQHNITHLKKFRA